jgi:hypothetical protein
MIWSLFVSAYLCYDAHRVVLPFDGATAAGAGRGWWRSAHEVGSPVLGG